MPFLRALACCLLLPAFALAGGPPVDESIDLATVTLNRLVLQPEPLRQDGLLPANKKQLPLSVQLYLRPSGQLNFLSRPVQRAAAQIRRAVAPGSAQKARLGDSRLLAQGLREWLDAALPLDPAVGWSDKPATDRRLAWPRVSEMLQLGKADADGRALAAVAILRALKVPARVAWARGRLACQYWVALKPAPRAPAKPKGKQGRTKKAAGPKPPLGYWALLDEGLHEAEVDAWSLDPGVLARAHWTPEQELNAPGEGWARAVFAEDASLTARAAYEASLSLGRLTGTAGALGPLSEAAKTVVGALQAGEKRTLWVLTVQHVELRSEGAMNSMDPVDLLTPYRPQLASWGRELNGCVREMELEAQGLWSDRPRRLRLSAGKPRDEWKSPPPALGVQHYLSFGLRRFGSVLQAQRQGAELSGILLRADNLSPRAGWTLSVYPSGVSVASQTFSTGSDGRFDVSLSAQATAADWIELSTPPESQLQWNGDQQRLPRLEP